MPQCHNHKFDPLTQEEYYRIFALLNDAHEANIAVYRPDEQMRRADLLAEVARIEAGLKERTPDWLERMAQWEATVRDNQPDWIVVRPDVDTSGGEKHLPQEDGSILAAGYAPTKHTVQMTIHTDVTPIGAFRLELLTDPNLPLAGPGRSILGTAALSEFAVEAAPASAPEKREKVKIKAATADVNPAEAPLPGIYDDRTKTRRTTGPIAFAIDGNNDTAWCTDNGPGRRNQPRKAVFTAEQPIAHAGGTILTISLVENHGGWNSDDNQNYNLGRFRFSVTAAADVAADPLPSAVREILKVPAAERTARQVDALFSYLAHDGGRVAGRELSNRRTVADASRRRVAIGDVAAERAARNAFAKARGFPQAGSGRHAGRAGVPAPALRRASDAAIVRSLAGGSSFADHGPLAGESGLAGLFRYRPGRDERRLGNASRSPLASGATGLVGRRFHGAWLEPEATASADRHVGDLSAIVTCLVRSGHSRSL